MILYALSLNKVKKVLICKNNNQSRRNTKGIVTLLLVKPDSNKLTLKFTTM